MGQVLVLNPRGYDPSLETLRRDAEDIHHMLRTLLETEGRLGSSAYVLPVPIEKLAEALGVRIELVDDLTLIAAPSVELEAEICGALSRSTRTIYVEARLPLEQRRYTIGHEYAHLLYHSDPIHYRQRAAKAQTSVLGKPTDIRVPHQEREAQRFSAEVLMPSEAVRAEMLARFGSPLDTTLGGDELAHFLSAGTGQKVTARYLREMPQERRAALVAQTKSFAGLMFEPLYRRFGVSFEAMARRLLELDLVS